MATDRVSMRAVDALKPRERDVYLWDSDLAGFGVKATPAGSKVYLVQYRLGGRNGRTRRITIGRHGTLTPHQARREAKRILGEVASGSDPAGKRAREKQNITIARLCDQYLVEAPSIVLPRRGRPKKASSLATDRSNIERHIKPLLGRKTVRGITKRDVEQFQREVAAGKTADDVKTGPRGRAIVRGGTGTAARAVSVLGTLFRYAGNIGIRPDNPVNGVTLFKSEDRDRFLSAIELARLGETLAVAEREGGNIFALAAIRLLVMTGCRKSEILNLQWKWIDFEQGHIRLPDSKTGKKIVPLGAPALKLLASLARIEGNPYVLPSTTGYGHLVGLQKIWQRLRQRAGLPDVRLHDLRHSFASIAVAGGDSLYLVGKILGHQQSKTTERYAHVANDPLRAVADRTAEQIAAAMSGSAAAEVVVLPKRKA